MPVTTEEHRFPCDTCGGDYRFDPAQGALVCAHCGQVQQVASGPWQGGRLREIDFDAAVADRLPETEIEETRVITCPNCAAQVEFDPDTHAAECPFCATPVVTDTGTHRHIKPRGILPFALTEAHAHEAMGNWLGRLWFAPSGLKRYARKGRRMQGIYVPYWTFDARTRSNYQGDRGTIYYETRIVIQNGRRVRQQVPKIKWSRTSGRVARSFDDILVLASQSLPKVYTDALQPWDLPALEPYQPEFLAGFRAEAYTVELGHGYTEARDVMGRVIERDVRFDIGGDRQRILAIDTEVSNVTFKHILLPIWLAAYKYRGKTYRFVVNGRTGQVQGERPYSTLKIVLAIIAGLFIAAMFGALASGGG
ncbi:TFIIB-type zinc finger domain-containing protein [Pukyongiella litopenaei]|uniref:Primosomal protein N' (Replication factor Y)-superfamily II helicase n=1 Tax=Pukyongiella litopenaei TaxID=2605946 RepID=A0A2S0MU09_9RHOB|nr:TFIIB-type zinc finger domain-containing protein [Pukyongiella litopenaei]AVO39384.1 primosomal protein N' (replication factor Y) - superfamily II helicase [Pukyongiella litopenaei]